MMLVLLSLAASGIMGSTAMTSTVGIASENTVRIPVGVFVLCYTAVELFSICYTTLLHTQQAHL